MRYINKRKAFINHIDQIKFQLKQYHEGFKFGGLKCLIFTREISRMKYIEEMVESEQIKVICIWSKHNKDNDLSDEQKRVRDHLIRYGTLPDPYNVLIINRALETGINITDKKMDLAIVNTTNETQQIQVRGRLRHDIDLLVCRTSDIKNMPDIPVELDHTWLNKNLTAQDKNDLADELKITDGKGRHLKWSTVKKILLENNYEVKEKSVQEDLKKKRVSVITKNKQISC